MRFCLRSTTLVLAVLTLSATATSVAHAGDAAVTVTAPTNTTKIKSGAKFGANGTVSWVNNKPYGVKAVFGGVTGFGSLGAGNPAAWSIAATVFTAPVVLVDTAYILPVTPVDPFDNPVGPTVNVPFIVTP